ncbi:ABC transporter permease [Haladaptatus sp. R4]|nr:ABC transporter permease [Haladaptatus sp. R4]
MTIIFLLIHSMPGSIISSMITPKMKPAQIDRIRQQWGLNQPLWKQYLHYMVNYQTGNFGRSPTKHVAVWDVIIRRFPRTIILFGAGFITAYTVGPLVGMYLGWWRGSNKDKTIYTSGLFMYSMPAFWIAWLFIWVFNYKLDLLKSAYMIDQFGVSNWTPFLAMSNILSHIALPLFSIAFVGWVGSMLVMRPSMNNVTGEDYVFLARAKGLSERTVMMKHAARNALIPVATQAIVGLAFLVDGSVIIEQVFSWPGIGKLLVSAVQGRDYPIAQAAFFMTAILIISMRLLTDVAYTFLDPRIKFGGD